MSQPTRSKVGKVALVTGSGQGIGRAIALRLAQEGADIIVHDLANDSRTRETLERVQVTGNNGQPAPVNPTQPQPAPQGPPMNPLDFSGVQWLLAILLAALGFVVGQATWHGVWGDLHGDGRTVAHVIWDILWTGLGFFAGAALGWFLEQRRLRHQRQNP